MHKWKKMFKTQWSMLNEKEEQKNVEQGAKNVEVEN